MKKTKEDFYPSLEEASAAARNLGFTSSTTYQSGYSQDEKLHSNPHAFYEDWESWEDFLSYKAKQFYPSICEASSAVRSLKPRPEGAVEYLELYKADPKLPSNPDKEYEGDWKGWKEFLGTNKGISKKYYQTIEEAIEAVQTIGGINSARTYKSRRALDKKLHSNPNVLYKDSWTGWDSFTNPSHQPLKLCA